MRCSMGRKHRGDTLVEVSLAVGIFSMVAITVVSVINGSVSGAQSSLESTITREEMDGQAEALRFIQSAYIASGEDIDEGNDSKYAQLWSTLSDHAIDLSKLSAADQDAVLKYNPVTCDEIYRSDSNAGWNTLKKQNAFIINTRAMSTNDLSNIITNYSSNIFKTATTYPRIIYGGDTSDALYNPSEITGALKITGAEGLYIIAVRDKDGTVIVSDSDSSTSIKSAYIDFYIRSCWFAPGADRPSTISTAVRLYDPSVVKSDKHIFNINYESDSDISWPGKPGRETYVTAGGKITYVIRGQNPTKSGYRFAGYNVCSADDSTSYASLVASCKPASDKAKINVANGKLYSGDRITIEARGKVTNVVIYPVFIKTITVSATVDDTTKNNYGTITLTCGLFYECRGKNTNVKSATITVPVGDTVIATANNGGVYTFLNWSGNGQTYYNKATWSFDAVNSTSITAHFTLDVSKLSGMKVLNVYPNSGGNLAGWMNSYGRGKISVDSTSINHFNSSYNGFNANSYDAIVFGFWDCNNSIDLSYGAASWVINNFINTNKVILFGHDTINYGTGTCGIHSNFNRFAGYAGFNTGSRYYSNWTDGPYFAGTTVVINVDSAFVDYPWTIGKKGTKLTIPYAHTLQQYVSNNNNVYLKFNSIDVNSGNFYLSVNNSYNVAMIQTGHSNGAATADEQKIIANTLFYMYTIYYKRNH